MKTKFSVNLGAGEILNVERFHERTYLPLHQFRLHTPVIWLRTQPDEYTQHQLSVGASFRTEAALAWSYGYFQFTVKLLGFGFSYSFQKDY